MKKESCCSGGMIPPLRQLYPMKERYINEIQAMH